jgi:Fur family zinc uptake transcriptional regulator
MSDQNPPPALAFANHDHARCRAHGLDVARRRCAERGLRLTPTRERVLEILLESHEAVGAYEVLKRLTEAGASPPQPPIAYRALDFLVANGFAHRIEKLNAYVACIRADDPHAAAFMICTGCGQVAEIEGAAAVQALSGVADRIGFRIEHATVEAEGLCAACRAAAA